MEWKSRFSSADAKEFREICKRRIMEIDRNGDAALALSGGTDSITVLFAMLDLGIKPRCYTFYMDGIISQDLMSSRKLAEDFGLELVEVSVPSDVDSIYNDVREIIPYCEKPKKTIIQCMIPWKYIYAKLQEDTIITGIGGDDLYGTQRKIQVELHRSGDEGVMKWRKCYSDDLDFSAGNIARYAKNFNKNNIDFYNTKDIFDYVNQFSLHAINKPCMKAMSIMAFKDYYDKGAYYRDQTDHSYQINSRLRDLHDMLLESKYNTNGSKAIIGIYNSIAKELEQDEK